MVEYPKMYALRETGVITQGPNAGEVLSGHIQELWDDNTTIEAARRMADSHAKLEPGMRIEIITRQFRSRPKRHFEDVLVEVYCPGESNK